MARKAASILAGPVMLLVVGISSSACGQQLDPRLTVSVGHARTLSGVDRVKTFDAAGVILFEGDATIADCAVIKVTSEAANISIDVSDADRNPVQYKQLHAATFM